MRGPVVVLAAMALWGCARQAYERTGHVLDSRHGLRWSNSPVVLERREPRLLGGQVEVEYSVVLENAGSVPVELLLSRAMARVAGGENTASAACRVLHGPLAVDVRLPVGQRTRVDCRLWLTPAGMRRLALGGSTLTLVIPTVHGDTPLVLAFAYQLHAEDAP